MPVDFFASPCTNPTGNCQNELVHCLQPINNHRFGISDASANQRVPAKIMFDNEVNWDFTIENNVHNILFKAIDFCVEIYRTGTYDVYNDESNISEFASDNIDINGNGLIKRCEGLLMNSDFILFFEIKNRPRGNWLIDARRKFEETILSFKEYHPHLAGLIIEPIVANKCFYRFHQSEIIQKKMLKDKIGVGFKIQSNFSIP
jgi:hypothetical protein